MRIVETYSHLNGEEYLLVHHPHLHKEIRDAIAGVDAHSLMTKTSREKTMRGRRLFSPRALNRQFKRLLVGLGWTPRVYRYCVTTNRAILDEIVALPLSEQKAVLREHGVRSPIQSYKQTDFVKDQVALEVQLCVQHDFGAAHQAARWSFQ